MRLLLFSDLHENVAMARRIVERADGFDVLVCAGDLANARKGLKPCIAALQECSKPTVLVAGNNESAEELRTACAGWRNAFVLHGTETTIAGVKFFGIGGGVPITPFGAWSWDFTESQAAELLRPCPKGCVLVSHSPPKGVLDRSSSGHNLGSTAVREAIVRCKPQLVVCGHIHASGGQHALFESTPVVNAGPGGVEWTL